MAVYTTLDITSVNSLVAAMAAVAADAGWTLDLNTAGRVHLHSAGGYHFEMYTHDGNTLGIVACTSYDAGQSATTQPGATTPTLQNLFRVASTSYSTATFWCAATAQAVYAQGYYCPVVSGLRLRAAAFGVITDKVGTWAGGRFIHGGITYADTYASYGLFSNNGYLYVEVNGQWTPNASFGGGGGQVGGNVKLLAEQPNYYNGGVLPLPVLLFLRNVTTTSLLHPIGYAPGLYQVTGGDVYLDGDAISISGGSYRVTPGFLNSAIKLP